MNVILTAQLVLILKFTPACMNKMNALYDDDFDKRGSSRPTLLPGDTTAPALQGSISCFCSCNRMK
jgi:hypothetical protein